MRWPPLPGHTGLWWRLCTHSLPIPTRLDRWRTFTMQAVGPRENLGKSRENLGKSMVKEDVEWFLDGFFPGQWCVKPFPGPVMRKAMLNPRKWASESEHPWTRADSFAGRGWICEVPWQCKSANTFSTCIKMSILCLHRSCEKLFLLALPNASDMFKLSHVAKV